MTFGIALITGFFICPFFLLTGCSSKKKAKQEQPSCVKTGKPVSKEKVEVPKDEKKEEEKKEEEKKEEEKVEEKKAEEKEEDKKKSSEDTKPDGPKPHITVEPDTELTFLATHNEQKKLKVTNIHDKKIMFKIKGSDITVYLIDPVFGTLEPGDSAEISITHRRTPAKESKIVIVNSVFAGDENDLAKSFKMGKPTGGPVTVKLIGK